MSDTKKIGLDPNTTEAERKRYERRLAREMNDRFSSYVNMFDYAMKAGHVDIAQEYYNLIHLNARWCKRNGYGSTEIKEYEFHGRYMSLIGVYGKFYDAVKFKEKTKFTEGLLETFNEPLLPDSN